LADTHEGRSISYRDRLKGLVDIIDVDTSSRLNKRRLFVIVELVIEPEDMPLVVGMAVVVLVAMMATMAVAMMEMGVVLVRRGCSYLSCSVKFGSKHCVVGSGGSHVSRRRIHVAVGCHGYSSTGYCSKS
jgi:hypothetical protein